jgi:predicted DNA-binding transcriptional regulator AlpA
VNLEKLMPNEIEREAKRINLLRSSKTICKIILFANWKLNNNQTIMDIPELCSKLGLNKYQVYYHFEHQLIPLNFFKKRKMGRKIFYFITELVREHYKTAKESLEAFGE